MRPEHRLMLRKLGRGMFDKAKTMKAEMRTMDVKPMEKKVHELSEQMSGLGVTKVKRKPLRFKL